MNLYLKPNKAFFKFSEGDKKERDKIDGEIEKRDDN